MIKQTMMAIQDMPGFNETFTFVGGLVSTAIMAGIVAAFLGIVSALFYGLLDTVKYFLVWRKKPEVECTVKKLNDTVINYSLNEIKSRDFVFDVEVLIESKVHTLKYTKRMKKEKPCEIKEGDSFLVFADTKKLVAEDAIAMKKQVKKNLILFAVCAVMIIVFSLLLKV